MGKKSDDYSLGIIIYYILFREYPYQGNTEYLIVKKYWKWIKVNIYFCI